MTNDWLYEYESYLLLLRNNNFENYEVIKSGITSYYKNYAGEAFLVKCKDLSSEAYEIVQIESNKLKYFESVESVLTQSKQSQSIWINAFVVV